MNFDPKWPSLEKTKNWYSMNEKEMQAKASFKRSGQTSKEPITGERLSESASKYGAKRLAQIETVSKFASLSLRTPTST